MSENGLAPTTTKYYDLMQLAKMQFAMSEIKDKHYNVRVTIKTSLKILEFCVLNNSVLASWKIWNGRLGPVSI